MKEPKLNSSWMAGRYNRGEINTALPYVAVNDSDFFAQGDEAVEIIEKIFDYWYNHEVSAEQAFDWWICNTF